MKGTQIYDSDFFLLIQGTCLSRFFMCRCCCCSSHPTSSSGSESAPRTPPSALRNGSTSAAKGTNMSSPTVSRKGILNGGTSRHSVAGNGISNNDGGDENGFAKSCFEGNPLVVDGVDGTDDRPQQQHRHPQHQTEQQQRISSSPFLPELREANRKSGGKRCSR